MFWLRGIDPATLYHYLIPFSRTAVWYLIDGVRMWRVAFQENRLIPRSSNTSVFEYRKFLFVYAQFIKNAFCIHSILSWIWSVFSEKVMLFILFYKHKYYCLERKINIRYIYFSYEMLRVPCPSLLYIFNKIYDKNIKSTILFENFLLKMPYIGKALKKLFMLFKGQ